MRAPVVTHGDPAPVFDAAEHVFDFVSLLVENSTIPAFFYDFLREGMHGFIRFFFNALINQSAS